MYHRLKVRFPWVGGSYEEVAIDDLSIDYIKPGEPGQSLVCDMDGVLCFEVDMPYEELVARLNGQEVPKKPEPVEIEAWAVISFDGKFFRSFRTKCEAEAYWDKLFHNDEYDVIPMKGSYIPWR